MASPEKTCEYVHLKLGFKLKSTSSWRGYEKVWNHPQPSTKNKPQPPTTIRNHVCNHPQTPATIQNHPQISQKPPTTTQKLRKKDKTFLILKQMLTLIVIWNNGTYTWMCMYRHYIYYFFVTLIVFVSKVIHLLLRAMSDVALKTFICSISIVSFLLMSGGYKRSDLQQNACMTFCYCTTL